jgi:hypothetical protein
VALPDAACPGLLRKPLDTAIGWLLAPYHPIGCQGDSKQNMMVVLMAIAMRRYYTAYIVRWRRFMAFTNATKRRHQASTRSNSINRTHQCRLFRTIHHKKGLLTCWSLITIGVWHIKLMRST